MVLLRWFVALLFFLFLSGTCHATTLAISDQPEQIDAATSFEVTVTFSGSKSGCGNKSYYLVGLLSKDAGSRLFGFTENNAGEWIDKSELPSRSYMFTTSEEGSWSGKIRIKANLNDEGFAGAGMYQLRIDRFTSVGTTKAESSNSVSFQLNYVPPATPTLPAAVGPTPTPTPPAVAGPTPTPVPTFNPTPQPTAKPTTKPTLQPSGSNLISSESASLLVLPPIASVAGVMTYDSPPSYAPWFILLGSLLVAGGVIPFGWKMLREEALQ